MVHLEYRFLPPEEIARRAREAYASTGLGVAHRTFFDSFDGHIVCACPITAIAIVDMHIRLVDNAQTWAMVQRWLREKLGLDFRAGLLNGYDCRPKDPRGDAAAKEAYQRGYLVGQYLAAVFVGLPAEPECAERSRKAVGNQQWCESANPR